MWPTLQVVQGLGGSARIDEISEAVMEREGFTDEQQQVLRRPDDRMTMIDYRLAWARNYLKNIGALENSARGVWAITDEGRHLDPGEIPERVREYKLAYYRKRKQQAVLDESEGADERSELDEDDWKSDLLDRLLEMDADAFERLAQRLLREAGFRNVEVLGRTGDGGIDGVGTYRLSLVSFPVYFQCKRYKGSVTPSAVRDFRGAMSGRGEKGLLITTGTFTRAARDEATRDGAPPVELISGDDLCDLLKEYQMGVAVQTVEAVEVRPEFFDQF
jgi:restriction system protein